MYSHKNLFWWHMMESLLDIIQLRLWICSYTPHINATYEFKTTPFQWK